MLHHQLLLSVSSILRHQSMFFSHAIKTCLWKYNTFNSLCDYNYRNVDAVASFRAVAQCQLDRVTLHWRHNDHDGVSNHQPHGCLLDRLFRRRSKKTSNLRVTGLYVGNSPGPGNSPHKGPVTRKMFPFDDVIMNNASRRSLAIISTAGVFLFTTFFRLLCIF